MIAPHSRNSDKMYTLLFRYIKKRGDRLKSETREIWVNKTDASDIKIIIVNFPSKTINSALSIYLKKFFLCVLF